MDGSIVEGSVGSGCEAPVADVVAAGNASNSKGVRKVVWVQTVEGGIQAIPQEVAFLSPFFQREAIHSDKGWNSQSPISLPKQITPEVLDQIVLYCQYHRAPGRSDKERKLFDEKFIRMDACRLCQLTSAADALDLRPLVDLASRALARLISGKTPEEIRATFNLPDDLTEEEKLEPVPFGTDEPRIRLLNRLYAKKRKELAERKAREAKGGQTRPMPLPREDTRSVDELVSFIESGEGQTSTSSGGNGSNPSGRSHAAKNSKRKKKRKGKKGESRSFDTAHWNENSADGTHGSDASSRELNRDSGMLSPLQNATNEGKASRSSSITSRNQASVSNSSCGWGAGDVNTNTQKKKFQIPDRPVEELFPEEGFEDEVGDPALDMEVADFARRLDSDWSIRLQELISVANPCSQNGNLLGAPVSSPSSMQV